MNRKTRNLETRIADNGNVIIEGVNYKGLARAAMAVVNAHGQIKATMITKTGIIKHLSPRGAWKRSCTRRGVPN